MLIFKKKRKEFDEGRRGKIFFEEMDFVVMENLFFQVLRDVTSDIFVDMDFDLRSCVGCVLDLLDFIEI